MKQQQNRTTVILLMCSMIVLAGCQASNAVKGGAIGAGGGAVVGGVIGHAAGNTALGAIMGAVIGGTAGAVIGNNMDKQAAEMKNDLKNARVDRVGEGIKITFDSGILFETNSYDLQSIAKTNVESLAKILNKYPDTNILIEGDTDNEGSTEYNQGLSERRAQAVANYGKGLNIAGSRITTVGHGESLPIAPNSTPEGRRQNRRVEVAIFANDDMKKAAQSGGLR